MTKPWNLPLEVATGPGEAAAANAATTSRGSAARSGSGPPRAARNSSALARAPTGLVGMPVR